MCGAFLGGAVFAGEEAGRERVIINDAELFLPANRLELGLEFLAVGKVVKRLQALVARGTDFVARIKRSPQPRRRHVGGPDRAHLARGNQRSVGLHGFFRRRDLIIEMGLVEIDIVGLQTPERRFAFAQDVILPEATAFAHVLADFGGDQHLVALAAFLHPVADDCFGLAAWMARDPARIAVGCVDGVEACVDKGIEDFERC